MRRTKISKILNRLKTEPPSGHLSCLMNIIYSWRIKKTIKACGEGFSIVRHSNHFIGRKGITLGSNVFSLGTLRIYVSDHGSVSIGNNTALNSGVYICSSSQGVRIGNHVLIGPNVVIRDSNHNYIKKDRLIRDQGHAPGKVIIEDDVWLCANVVICPGVIVKRGCVIAAGSVLTHTTEEFSVYAGSPARKISERL